MIIPVYNTEQYLPRALDSILNQTFDTNKIKVVVVNDGSPKAEECRGIVREYSKKLSIKFIDNEKNQGLFMARKLGVANVSDEVGYLLHLDSDDYLSKNTCKVLYEDIEKNGDADYIEFNYYSQYGIFKTSSFIKKSSEDKILEDILSYKKSHTPVNKCYNISFVKNIYANMPNFYSYYNEDYYQMGIIEYYAKKRRFIKASLYVYVRGTGVTGLNKYEKEKLKKILLSIYNVEENLVKFYEAQHAAYCIPLVHSYSERLYGDAIARSNGEDFMQVAKEILSNETINNAFVNAVSKYEYEISFLEKRVKLLLPIKIITKPFLFIYRYVKNIYTLIKNS
ncbi:MAG: glycosyltransferase family 2 protein [Treponema sp.]